MAEWADPSHPVDECREPERVRLARLQLSTYLEDVDECVISDTYRSVGTFATGDEGHVARANGGPVKIIHTHTETPSPRVEQQTTITTAAKTMSFGDEIIIVKSR